MFGVPATNAVLREAQNMKDRGRTMIEKIYCYHIMGVR